MAQRAFFARSTTVAFDALSIEGGLLAAGWLLRVAQLQAPQQDPADYGVPKGIELRDEIGRSWRIAQAHWVEFETGRRARGEPEALSHRFVVALLREALGFTDLVEPSQAIVVAERLFPITVLAGAGRVPVVIVAAPGERSRKKSALDEPSVHLGDARRKRSAFGLLQEFLNVSRDALWGLASDGLTLRLLRDNASLTRPAWIEIDLARIFTEGLYPDFSAMWLLLHRSRFGRPDQEPSRCALETWRTLAQEEGTRARDRLRVGFEEALAVLGQGFLAHPANGALRGALHAGTLGTKAYFGELLRLVYRLIFLLAVEERERLHPKGTPDEARERYALGYSVRRLRDRSLRRAAHDRHHDLWEALKIVFRGLWRGQPALGLPALGGLFAPTQCPHLDASSLENRVLLGALFKLCWLKEPHALSRVSWRDMDTDELGYVYEGLLELEPHITQDGRTFSLRDHRGNDRKTSGSYYTPESLVSVLLDTALEPVIAHTLAAHPTNPVKALLELTIVDPACGSGHFLLSAARRLATHLARIHAGGTPSAEEYRRALRQVVAKCLFGVDLNPMAVELCKVSLWLEAVDPGLPLTFLDAHIQHGNALLGATPALMEQGIPDAAWEPLEGDDKKVASALKKRNKAEAKQGTLDFGDRATNEAKAVTQAVAELDAARDDDAQALADKEQRWTSILSSEAYRHQKLVADAWCAAFLWPKQAGPLVEAAPTNAVWRRLRDAGTAAELTVETTQQLAEQYRFFHWHLQFPQVFAKGGFDVVLGNPPWVAHAGRAAQRLVPGVRSFLEVNYESFADYPTTHGVFVGHIPSMLCVNGRLGFIVPSSLSELGGYAPARRAHDRFCKFVGELKDFGEGQFRGVTQPCMALVSVRAPGGRTDAAFGDPWPMERPDLTAADRKLLLRLSELPTVPPELFGECGIQSDPSIAEHFVESRTPTDRFTCPVREGTDVREFQLLPPRIHVDRSALGGRIRSHEVFSSVRIVVRQTARYPIAALSDGMAFRNSLLAGFELPGWPREAVVALLNSALVRWFHFMQHRDARQPVMPQVKIAHLRAIPAPPDGWNVSAPVLQDLARKLTRAAETSEDTKPLRAQLDRLVFTIYGLTEDERAAVEAWHQLQAPPRRGQRA
jgi:hypothetical protein